MLPVLHQCHPLTRLTYQVSREILSLLHWRCRNSFFLILREKISGFKNNGILIRQFPTKYTGILIRKSEATDVRGEIKWQTAMEKKKMLPPLSPPPPPPPFFFFFKSNLILFPCVLAFLVWVLSTRFQFFHLYFIEIPDYFVKPGSSCSFFGSNNCSRCGQRHRSPLYT